MRDALYLYCGGPHGDLVWFRPLIRELLALERFEIVLGACRNDVYLVADLFDDPRRLLVCDYRNGVAGAPVDLAYLSPAGHAPVPLSFTEHDGMCELQWENVVEIFNVGLEDNGLDFVLEVDDANVPMLDLPTGMLRPQLEGPSVYLDSTLARCRYGHFRFDQERLVDALPGCTFFCTSPPDFEHTNLIDCSHLDLVECAALSERCEVLLGLTFNPFHCTFTEANRFKPKAVCGYNAIETPSVWDYPASPMEYLSTMGDVIEFLISNLCHRVRDDQSAVHVECS